MVNQVLTPEGPAAQTVEVEVGTNRVLLLCKLSVSVTMTMILMTSYDNETFNTLIAGYDLLQQIPLPPDLNFVTVVCKSTNWIQPLPRAIIERIIAILQTFQK